MRFAFAAALLLPATAHAGVCTGPVCNFETLAPYFAKLAGAPDARGMPPVHILQIGDSHTAGDVLTGSWRELLQAKAGSGGRGVLPPGRPYAGYLTHGVTASMSDGWRVATSFGPASAGPLPPLGLSGFSLTSTRSGASMGLIAEPGMAFDRFVVCAIAAPGAGTLTVRIGDIDHRLGFAADMMAPRCETLRAETPQTSVGVTATDGPVTITSWATFRDDGGVALSNLGIVGSQLFHFGRTDDAVLTEELRAYAPDLIILAFGTNEGFSASIDAVAYEATLRQQVERVRGLAPDVPILLLGPPDALSRQPGLRGDARYCRILPGIEPLFAPPGLAQVRAVQRKVAGEMHLAWWDWQARMGGVCMAQRWVNADPPRMRGDYVHFRDPGGRLVAQMLQDDLNRAAGEQ